MAVVDGVSVVAMGALCTAIHDFEVVGLLWMLSVSAMGSCSTFLPCFCLWLVLPCIWKRREPNEALWVDFGSFLFSGVFFHYVFTGQSSNDETGCDNVPDETTD